MSKSLRQLSKFYGDRVERDAEPFFTGGFLNFGYWKDIPTDCNFGLTERTKSGRDMYRNVLDNIDIANTDRVLEVGCGKGQGARIAFKEYLPLEVHGVDAVLKQVERARRENADLIQESMGRLIFEQGIADDLPYADNYFDKVISIEAAPHFPDFDKFAHETIRVVRGAGVICIASIFTPSRSITSKDWENILGPEEVPASLIYAHSISDCVESFSTFDVKEIAIISIGEHVWESFDAYLACAGMPAGSNRRKWLSAYEEKLLDYYMVTVKL